MQSDSNIPLLCNSTEREEDFQTPSTFPPKTGILKNIPPHPQSLVAPFTGSLTQTGPGERGGGRAGGGEALLNSLSGRRFPQGLQGVRRPELEHVVALSPRPFAGNLNPGPWVSLLGHSEQAYLLSSQWAFHASLSFHLFRS